MRRRKRGNTRADWNPIPENTCYLVNKGKLWKHNPKCSEKFINMIKRIEDKKKYEEELINQET